MNLRTPSTKYISFLAGLVLVVMTLLPFHAFLTVWAASFIGHYTAVRLWKEALLVVAIAVAAIVVNKNPEIRRQLQASKLVWCIGAYGGFTVLVGMASLATGQVTLKALAYGLIINLRFLAWFLVLWVVASKRSWFQRRWPRWVFWPAGIVCLIAILQYFVLPYDVLKHFGYGADTIFPYQTINNNPDYPRIMSTLRGANPLGAYLLVIITLLMACWRRQRQLIRWPTIAIAALVLLLTFSRAAWLGTVVSVLALTFLLLRNKRFSRQLALGSAALCIMGGGLFWGLQHNRALQNAVFHTDDASTVAVSSNEGHGSALRDGLTDGLHQPFGRGVGTAGPASVYNDGQSRIAENYYLQLVQEVGWFGLGLFLAINVLLVRALWWRRDRSLARGLLAAFIGLFIVNLLSHAWTDDTLAYIWWGLAGIALAMKPEESSEKP